MDTGNGKFEFIDAPNRELMFEKFEEVQKRFPNHGGTFHVGQILEIEGSKFRVKSIKPDELRLKLLAR